MISSASLSSGFCVNCESSPLARSTHEIPPNIDDFRALLIPPITDLRNPMFKNQFVRENI